MAPLDAPEPAEIAAFLRNISASRGLFAALVGLTVASALLTARALGLEHPNWVILALVVVLHADARASRRLIVNLFAGAHRRAVPCPLDRLTDISLGCGFSIAALWANAPGTEPADQMVARRAMKVVRHERSRGRRERFRRAMRRPI